MFLLLGFAVAGLIGGSYYLWNVHNPEPLVTPSEITGDLSRVTVNRRGDPDVKGCVLLSRVMNYNDWDVKVTGFNVEGTSFSIPVVDDETHFCVLYAPCRASDLGLDKIVVTGHNPRENVSYNVVYHHDEYLNLGEALSAFDEKLKSENQELAEVPDE